MVNQSTSEKKLWFCDCGIIPYADAWELQKRLFTERKCEQIPDIFLLLEHPHTYTLGKVASKNNLLASDEYLKSAGIDVFEIDRGGDITYHGPGQIVGYPIIDLALWEKDSHKYLRALEEVIISTISFFGIKGERNPAYTGVWVEDRKIAAIGIKISSWITMHGFALNVNTELNMFNGIIPCGITDKSVTSIQKETGKKTELLSVKAELKKNFYELFGYTEVEEISPEHLIEEFLSKAN